MAMGERGDPLVIRSYRGVFKAGGRRLYRIDRFRLPTPYGVPLRGLGYALVLVAVIATAAPIPVLGDGLGALPASLRLVGLPVLGAWLALAVRLDGRPVERTVLALLAWALGPRVRAHGRALGRAGPLRPLGDVVVFPDLRGWRYRSGTLRPADRSARIVLRGGGTVRRTASGVVVDGAPQGGGAATALRVPEGREVRVR